MTFRTPLTTATAVDTGQPSGAGVRVYQQAVTGGTQGVVEFRDGIAGDAFSVVTAAANLVPLGDGTFHAQGGGMGIRAGSWNGVVGPSVSLNVEEAPAGGYTSIGRLAGADQWYIGGAPWAQQRAWNLERAGLTSNTADNFTSANGNVTLIDRSITDAPAGDYALTATLFLYAAAGVVGNFTLKAGPVLSDLIGTPRCDLVGGPVLPYTQAGTFTHTGGNLRCLAGYQVTTSGITAACFTAGSAIRVAYLGPRT